MNKRICKDKLFMNIAENVAKRSTCLRRNVGAVLVNNDNHIIATGYNGAPIKIKHCKKCFRQEHNVKSAQMQELCRGSHAELNAIVQCALHNTSTNNAIMYVTVTPCSMCAKAIINAKISKIIYKDFYPDKLGLQLLKEAHIKIEKIK